MLTLGRRHSLRRAREDMIVALEKLKAKIDCNILQ